MTTKLNADELSPLQRHVYRWALKEARDYDNHDWKEPLEEITQHGCSSGMVNHLIYTVDCVRFYRRFMKEIDQLLSNLCNDTGDNPGKIFKAWDDEDPLARDDFNKNILAWFGFEETANTLLSMIEN